MVEAEAEDDLKMQSTMENMTTWIKIKIFLLINPLAQLSILLIYILFLQEITMVYAEEVYIVTESNEIYMLSKSGQIYNKVYEQDFKEDIKVKTASEIIDAIKELTADGQLIDGNSTVELPEPVVSLEPLEKVYTPEYVATLSKEKQVEIIGDTLYLQICERIFNSNGKEDIADLVTQTLKEDDKYSHLWVAKTGAEFKDPQAISGLIKTNNYIIINLTDNISNEEKVIRAHLNVQMTYLNHCHLNNIPFELMLNNKDAYRESLKNVAPSLNYN